jgi:hypothetical protein
MINTHLIEFDWINMMLLFSLVAVFRTCKPRNRGSLLGRADTSILHCLLFEFGAQYASDSKHIGIP